MASVELIDMQPELAWYMRPYLVDFLIEIHQQYRLRPETLYLALNIVDRYVSKRIVYKKHYQLVGCAALWIASKFEDAKDRVPTVEDLCAVCCSAYDQSAFIQMEGHVLSTIGWSLGHPTAEAWLRIACASPALPMEDTRTQHIARFIMEITLFHRAFVSIKPSDIAAACLTLARYMCATNAERASRINERGDVLKIAQMLDAHLAEHLDQVSATVVKKYSPAFYSRASVHVQEWYLSGRRFIFVNESSFPVTAHPSSEPPEIDMVNSSPSSSSSSTNGDSDFDEDTSSSAYASTPITPTTSVSSCSSSHDSYERIKMPQFQQQLPQKQTAYFSASNNSTSTRRSSFQVQDTTMQDVHATQQPQGRPALQWQMSVIPPPTAH